MWALVWRGPRVLGWEEVPRPEPGPGEVLIRVRAVGVCGSELGGYLGQNTLRVPPLVMGHEFAGEIAALGPGAAGPLGARVVVNPLLACGACPTCARGAPNLCPRRSLIGAHRPGAFAEYVAVPEAALHPLPPGVDWVQGSLAEPLACGVRAVARAEVPSGAPLVVLGAGPMGLVATVAARARGLGEVVVADPNPRRLAVVRAIGAVGLTPEELAPWLHARWPDGVPVVLDAVGSGATRRLALRTVAPGGRVVALGLHEHESPVPVGDLVRGEVALVGTFAYAPEDFAQALALLGRGQLVPDPSWLETRPLAEGPQVFADLVARGARDAVTKTVLLP
jgi:threonine dehydrogenase-like Zn-dependent dehydrogenase